MGEPIEAEFIYPPALTSAQEEQFRELDIEGPLQRPTPSSDETANARAPSLKELERAFTRQGVNVVQFTPGAGEDPREWTRGKKWFVAF